MGELKRNQHYVPQCYLRRFSTPGTKSNKTYAAKIRFDCKIYKDQSIKNLMSEDFFYDSKFDSIISDKYPEQPIENFFSEMESHFSKYSTLTMDRLTKGYPLDEDIREFWSYWFLLQYTRTKSFRSRYSKGSKYGMGDEDYHALMITQVHTLDPILEMIQNSSFIVGKATGMRFVTSDSPIVFLPSQFVNLDDIETSYKLFKQMIGDEIGKDSIGFDMVLPMSPDLALIAVKRQSSSIKITPGQTMCKLSEDYTANIVGHCALSASEFIIASERDHLVKAVKLRRSALEWQEKLTDEQRQKMEKARLRLKQALG